MLLPLIIESVTPERRAHTLRERATYRLYRRLAAMAWHTRRHRSYVAVLASPGWLNGWHTGHSVRGRTHFEPRPSATPSIYLIDTTIYYCLLIACIAHSS